MKEYYSKNVAYLPICKSIGYIVGTFLGYTAAITLDSPEFCNDWIWFTKKSYGIFPLEYTFAFWGIMFILIPTLIAMFKRENVFIFEGDNTEVVMTLKQNYRVIWEILKLKQIHKYAVLIITSGIMHTVCTAVAPLKFLDIGITKEVFAMMDIPLIPIHFIALFVVGNYFLKSEPMNLLWNITPCRLFLSLVTAFLIFIAPMCKNDNEELPGWYYIAVLISYSLQQILRNCEGVSVHSFEAYIADPRCASTYATLLRTMGKIGSSERYTASIWLVDKLTWERCECLPDAEEPCLEARKCTTIIDGFYVEITASILIGLIWLIWARKKINRLHSYDRSTWLLNKEIFYKK